MSYVDVYVKLLVIDINVFRFMIIEGFFIMILVGQVFVLDLDKEGINGDV